MGISVCGMYAEIELMHTEMAFLHPEIRISDAETNIPGR